MNVLIVKERSCLSAKERYIYEVGRWERPERPETFAQAAKPDLADVTRQAFLV